MRGTEGVTQLLVDWIDQHNRSKAAFPAVKQRSRNGMGPAEVTVKDSAPWDSDQWLLGALFQRKLQYLAVVEEIRPRHVYNAFPSFAQTLYRPEEARVAAAPAAGGRHTDLADRVVRNGTAILAGLWRDMRLPQGDEVPGESLLVHFAG